MLLIFLLIIPTILFFVLGEKYNSENWVIAGALGAILSLIILVPIAIVSSSNCYDQRNFFDLFTTQFPVTKNESCVVLKVSDIEKTIKESQLAYSQDGGYYINFKTEYSNASMVQYRINAYNRSIIEKRNLNKNIWLNWLISNPDEDMLFIRSINE